MYTAEKYLADLGITPTRGGFCPILWEDKYDLEKVVGTPLEGVVLTGSEFSAKNGDVHRVSVAHRRLNDVGMLAPFLQRNIATWCPTDPGWEPDHVTEAALKQDIVTPRNRLRHDFIIFDRQYDLAGVAKLTRDVINKKNYQIGYAVGKEHEGKGIASNAVRLLLSFAAQELGAQSVDAYVIPGNIGSVKVLERNQFEKRAIYYDRLLNKPVTRFTRVL